MTDIFVICAVRQGDPDVSGDCDRATAVGIRIELSISFMSSV